MFLLVLPALLAGPLLLLASAVVRLCAHGPLGWLASALLLGAIWVATSWCARRVRAWWRGTKAPERPSAAREKLVTTSESPLR